MDVERAVARRLAEATGIRAFVEVPERRPDEFVSVEMVAGGGGRFVSRPTLAVQSWARTRRRAAEIAAMVERAVPGLADEENVFAASSGGSRRWPDPSSGQARYQTAVKLAVCE